MGDAFKVLGPIASNFFMFGVVLHINYDIMNELRKNCEKNHREGLHGVLINYANKNYNISRFGLPTFRKLVAAVSSSSGGSNHRLAKDFAVNHPCKLTPHTLNIEIIWPTFSND